MTSIIKNSAIIAGVVALAAYAIYRYAIKRQSSKPISYETILNKAISKIKETNATSGQYELVILPPSKARLFLSQNPDFLDNISMNDLKGKELVIWHVQNADSVIYQEALISDSLSPDFTDVVALDKIYKKVIKFDNQ